MRTRVFYKQSLDNLYFSKNYIVFISILDDFMLGSGKDNKGCSQ